MAMIDYGAILRVDGKIVNKEELFMECSDTGYVCEKAYYPETDKWYDIDGNYYVYAGDDNFLVVFYKEYFSVISKGIYLGSHMATNFVKETMMFDGLPTITVEHIDKKMYMPKWLIEDNAVEDWEFEWWTERYGIRKARLLKDRWIKKHRRNLKDKSMLRYNGKQLATWEYNGKKYECVFGYGVDSSEKLWNEGTFQKDYNYTDKEIEFIGKWFEGDK